MTATYTAPISCVNEGTLTMVNNGSALTTVLINPTGSTCAANGGTTCTIPNLPFGTYTVQINVGCPPPSNSIVNCNGQNGVGVGFDTVTFTLTTDIVTPNIDIDITCV
jgi:hypothetical protein